MILSSSLHMPAISVGVFGLWRANSIIAASMVSLSAFDSRFFAIPAFYPTPPTDSL